QHLYSEAFEKDVETPIAARAMLAAARLHRQCHQTHEAIGLYRKLLQQQSVVALDVVLYELAWLLRDANQIAEADELFERIHHELTDSTYWADATYRLAEDARVRREFDAADGLTSALLENPNASGLHE